MPRDEIEDWLSLLETKAAERGVSVDFDVDGQVFHFLLGDEDPVLGKVRISKASSRNFTNERGETYIWQRFDREQERLQEDPDQRVCSIQLDIQDDGSYQEGQDHFLFIPGELILQETYSKGDQKIYIASPGEYRGELGRYADDWDALFEYATVDLSLDEIDEEQVQTKLQELADEGDADIYELPRNEDPSVWIEKTQREGRTYKQEGELALGKAIIAPSRDEAGRKRYETMREAEIGDVVLHLLQEQHQIVGVSRISSELQEDFQGPPDDRWSEEQISAGGYKRDLEGYLELDDPIEIYDQVLSNEKYKDDLQRIRKEYDGKILYTKRLTLNQGHYFTKAPEEFVNILVSESEHLAETLPKFGVGIPDAPPDVPDPAESYDTLTDAMDDIYRRLKLTTISNWLAGELTSTVIEDWSNVLTNFGPNSSVSLSEDVRLQQIRRLYSNNVSRFRESSEELGSGALDQVNKPQTLFVAFLRDLQDEAGIATNVNQVKIKLILNEEYEIESLADDDGVSEDDSPLSHPILEHFDLLPASTPIRKFTAPADFWLTAIQYGTVSFEEEARDIWEDIEAGEIAFLHSSGGSGDIDMPGQTSGIFGVGILGAKSTKDELWWRDETDEEPFPYLITFERLYVTSDINKLDVSTPITEHSQDSLQQQLKALTGEILEFSEVQSICEETNGIGFPAQGAHAVFRDENNDPDHNRPLALLTKLRERLKETSTVNKHVEFDGTVSMGPLDELYFPGEEKEDLIEQIEAALRTGKHIILTGPPGTGKTEIARRICASFVGDYPHLYSDFQLTTATADWSTFDTVGGYMPEESEEDGEDLSFNPGVVLNRFKERRNDRQLNEPIVIDELNRADIDKAFGQLFTLLSGQSVQLPYTKDGQEIELLAAEDIDHHPKSHQYVVPESWRIFATMNTYDKTSLYEMSYAFMRRFAFIRVGVPDLPDEDDQLEALMFEYAGVWGLNPERDEATEVGRVWRAMNQPVDDRAIGPAIVQDILTYVMQDGGSDLDKRLTHAVISYIFPQLEGVPKREQILRAIAKVDRVERDMLAEASAEMLQVNLRSNE